MSDDPEVRAWLDPRRGRRRRRAPPRRDDTAEVRLLPDQPAGDPRDRGAGRGCWGIETKLHRVLDLACREDESRARTGHAAEDFAVLRRTALNLLGKMGRSRSASRPTPDLGLDESCLLKALAA